MSNGLLADPQLGKRDADTERCTSEARRPLAIDLYCGLGGWASGFLSEGYNVIGFDIEARPYPGQLVLQDVLTIHGRQFKDAATIVASPPCQAYSYMAMPWSRGKAIAAEIRGDSSGARRSSLNALFDACFRIQREASEAAGRYIPMVVENVAGAQAWVGQAAWHYGSFYLWGDVPALMPFSGRYAKVPGMSWSGSGQPDYRAVAFNGEAARRLRQGTKTVGHANQRDGYGHTRHLTNQRESDALKVAGFNFHEHEKTGKPGRSFQSAAVAEGTKGFAKRFEDTPMARLSSKPSARKAASAQIAKIPFALSSHIARVFKPCSLPYSPIYQPEEKNLESRKEGI